MKKIFRLLFLILSISLFGVSLSACNSSSDDNNISRYEVAFETYGGTMYYNVRANEGDTITLPTPQKEGYEFLGWWDNEGFAGVKLETVYIVSKNITLHAKWDAFSGVVTFESNGGTLYNDLEFSALKVTLPTPQREGYAFGGWYTNPEFSGEQLAATFLPTSSMTVYAKWEAIVGSIIFESNGGTMYEKVDTTGQKVALPTPVKEDYEFAGWYDNPSFTGNVYEGEYLPNGTLILYARWASDFKLISFEENGGEELKDIKLFDEDSLELPTPFRYGYSFCGWYLNEEFTGEPVDDYFYRPTEDVKLYAKWEECSYLYLFYGPTKMEWVKFECYEGDVITVDELNALFTPSELTVKDYLGFEHNTPFKNWAYFGYDETSHIDVTGDIVIDDKIVMLVAVYDESSIPEKEYLTLNHETGVYTTTGKVAHLFIDQTEGYPYVYSLDISVRKGTGGAVGPAFRLYVPETDYHYEAGCEYLCPGISPDSGSMQLSSVLAGDWSKLAGVSFAALPQGWREKFNNTKTGELLEFTISIIDYNTSFEVYIDGELAYTYSDAEKLALYPYKGLGVRSSSTPSNLSNPKISYGYNISFETGDETLKIEDVIWYVGDIELPQVTKEDYVLEGWYYDSELTQRVDGENFYVNDHTKLYAKWSDSYYVVSLNTNGGVACDDVKWVSGKINLPTPVKMNYVFTGWYYDSALTELVDPYNFNINDNITVYAGWRLTKDKLTNNGNGSYTYNGSSTLAVVGIVDNPIPTEGSYIEYTQTITMPKGSGSVGIAFRVDKPEDNLYEAGTNYLSVQFSGSGLRISRVTNGNWTRLVSDRGLTTLPQSWQDKYNNTADGAIMVVDLMIRDYGSYFEAYIDGVLAYTYGKAGETHDISTYVGNGYGVRSSGSNVIIYSNMTATFVAANE